MGRDGGRHQAGAWCYHGKDGGGARVGSVSKLELRPTDGGLRGWGGTADGTKLALVAAALSPKRAHLWLRGLLASLGATTRALWTDLGPGCRRPELVPS